MIRKNSIINVNRKDGTIILARATKVAPWVKNPNVTIVNWISFDEQWKSTADLKNCTLATALEVSAASKEKEVAMAPLDACMEGYSLGKTKKGPMMMEGYYFAIGVYKDNKKIGELVDEGNGGPVMSRFTNHADGIIFGEACRKWAMQNLADGRYGDEYEHFWGWWDEARPKGIDAKTYFKNEKEHMLKFMAGIS